MLDPDKLTHVCAFFIDRTLERILVNFDKDFAKLQRIVFRHETQKETEVTDLAKTSLQAKSEFWCFLFTLEKKYTPKKISNILHTIILERVLKLSK